MRGTVSLTSVELYVRQFGVLVSARISQREGKAFLCWEDPENFRPITAYLGDLVERTTAPAQLPLLDSFKT